MLIKEKLYNYFVRKNGRVWYEYERYVREHIEEHRLHRFSHIVVLLKLNWFYRVKKGNTPYLYWDVPLTPIVREKQKKKTVQQSINKTTKTPIWKSNAFLGCESKSYPTWKEVHLIKRFLEYDAVVFKLFDNLVYSAAGSKKNFFNMLEKEFAIPRFSDLRAVAEQEADVKAKKRGKVATIRDVYEYLEKYTGVEVEKGIEKEIEFLKKITYPNAFMKDFYDMLSYNYENIYVMENTLYSSIQIREILECNGFGKIAKVFVNNENCTNKNRFDHFLYVSKELQVENIIYMGDDPNELQLASLKGWDIWEYRNSNEKGNQFRPIELYGKTIDSYKAIVNQKLYCGHYQFSQKKELGYVYFGVTVLGFLNWVKNICKFDNITRISFLYSTGEILKSNYKLIDKRENISTDTLMFSEEIAVRCLVDVQPSCFYEFYIERKIKGNYTISYYMEKMGLRNLEENLVDYGIVPTDIVTLNGDVYHAFMDFIGKNLFLIKNEYENEIQAICKYIEEQGYTSDNITIVDVCSKGYIAKALQWILNNRMNSNSKVIELSMFQMTNADNALYSDGIIKSYMFEKDNTISGFNLPINIGQGNYYSSVFSDRKPRLCGFRYDIEKDNYILRFGDAYPWRYNAISEIQKGINTFILDYLRVWEDDNEMMNFSSKEIALILRNIMSNNDYIKTHIPIILV